MKLEEDLKAVRYIRERVDLIVNDEGFVILPAWQFARFVDEYESYRRSNFVWLAVILLMAVWFLIWIPVIS